jgi:NAD(P)-dependent dehydrogenase (short-subunit alcohol dehydrogenase family)
LCHETTKDKEDIMHAIVAGASRGIGFEVVRSLARAGSNRIVAVSRNAGGLDELAGTCSADGGEGRVIPLAMDLAAGDIGTGLIPLVREQLGTIDLLIYNAGYLVNKPFASLDGADFDRSFQVNVRAPFMLIQALLPHFNDNAHVLTISSMGGYQGSAKFAGLSLYSASKGALAVLTECLAEELRDRGIKCNCLALGAVQTEMLAEAFPGYKAPLTPGEMGSFIADFGMIGHRFFNGKILPVSLSTP